MADFFPSGATLAASMEDAVTLFEPRYTNIKQKGDLGRAVLHGVSEVLGDLVFPKANTLQDRVQFAALEDLGQKPRPAQPSKVGLKFTLTAAQPSDFTIPVSRWGVSGLAWTLDAPVIIPAGQLTHAADALATCESVGSATNVAANTITQNLSSIAFIASVTNPERALGGEDAETEAAFLARAANEFAQHNMLVREEDFAQAAADLPGVLRATCLPVTSFAAPSTFTTPHPGRVTVLAMPDDGGLLTTELRDEILESLRTRAFVDLDRNGFLFVTDYTRSSIAVAVTVKARDGYPSTGVTTAVTAALTAFLNPKTWIAGRAVRLFETGEILEALPQVDFVDTLTLNGSAAAVALPVHALAQPGVITVTVLP